MAPQKKKNSGFTLLEVMISSAILIVALLGLIAVYTGCFTLNEGARNLTIAINDAQCVMEEIRDRNIPSNITQEDWTDWALKNPPDGGGCNSLNNETIAVTWIPNEADPLEITVTVEWKEKGRDRNAQLITLLAER